MKITTLFSQSLNRNLIARFQTALFFAFLIQAFPLMSKNIIEKAPEFKGDFSGILPVGIGSNEAVYLEDPCESVPAFVPAHATEADLSIGTLPATIRITGSITISSSLTLTGKTIIMDPGTSIFVEAYASLTLTNCIVEGCLQMWDGIYVGSHGTLRIQSSSQINDMRYGIDPTLDAWIYLHDSQFKRNYYTVLSKNDGAFTFEFFGNTLDGSNLKPYLDPQTGLLIAPQALFGLWFESAVGTQDDPIKVGSSLQTQNLIRHCATGIYAKTSDFDIDNNRFLDIKGGIGRSIHIDSSVDHTIQNCVFDYVRGGIYAQTSYYLIKDNHFNHVGYAGIARNSRTHMGQLPTIHHNFIDDAIGGFTLLFNDNSNPQITANTFTNHGGQAVLLWDVEGMANRCSISNNTIHLKSPDDFDSGIQIIGTTKASICDNPIDYDGASVWENKGITAWASTNCIITNNDCTQNSSSTLEANTGVQAFYLSESKLDCNYYTANNKGLHVLGSCLNTEVTTQHFLGPHTTGLFYDNASTKKQIHNGNAWEYAPSTGQNAALGTGIDIQANMFIVDPSDGAIFAPVDVDPQAWFQSEMGGNTKTCNHATVGCTLPPPNFQNSDEEIIRTVVSGQLTFPNYADCLGWMATRQALGWIVRNNLQNSTAYANYWTQNATTSAGILAQLEFNSTDWEQSQGTLESQINTKWNDVQQLLSSGPLSQVQLNLLMQYYQDLKDLKNSQASARLNLIAQYRNTLSTLPSTQVFEANKKTVGMILCDLYGREAFECNTTELSALRSVASQCAFEGGDAVLQARGLLGFLADEPYHVYSGCSPIQGRENEKTDPGSDFQVLPNPNNGTIEILFPDGAEAQHWDLEIFDLSGRSCWRGSSENRTNVTGLSAGAYIIVCTNDKTGTRLSKRLVIQK
ncbi:MAG: right-handed parallel beta-helix repeat-containing protein [Phycisphaerae bacterium]|nr:right-handed parallel beta-helix repeat-containing protein [Saprospiraceae bacterium]